MKPLGLYVHWPFCARICPYCDFTVAKARAVDEKAWGDALVEDLERLSALTEPRPLASVYFGGGTPSLIPPRVAERIVEAAERLFGIADGAEWTVEANPDDRARFSLLKDLGFRRLSLGVQSFSDAELTFLGRNHDAADAQGAVAEALALFDQVSLDFIYALPDQSLADWEAALRHALSIGAKHLSLYQLTIEEGTAFGKAAARGSLIPLPDDRAADFYELTQDLTAAAGLPAYEVSNHAVPGAEAVHNALYWHDAEWLGVGPGAHGRLEKDGVRRASLGARAPVRYAELDFVERMELEALGAHAIALETLSSGLRPTRGLDLRRLGAHGDEIADQAEPLISEGLMVLDGGRLAATPRGCLVLDQLTSFLADGLPDD